MTPRVVVVDGSNLATEGRSMPSLRQLDECVRAFMAEYPDDTVIVVVDATFGHRIDASEVGEFDEAVRNAELVTPPAGAIGRGDAFVLQIADKAGAAILSNDSFQEFHGEYPWVFDEGRLIGGKPVPHIGWVFVPRSPVRGPASRKAVRDARKARPRAVPEAPQRVAVPAGAAPGEAAEQADGRRRRRARPEKPEPINEALPFIEFIAEHPLGTVVEGEVESFSSHGAYVLVGGARCYAPLRNLGDPPPRSAKQLLSVGERRSFVVVALEPTRRSIDLALPGVARVEVPVPEPAAPMSKAEAKRARKAAKELEAAERAAGEVASRAAHAVGVPAAPVGPGAPAPGEVAAEEEAAVPAPAARKRAARKPPAAPAPPGRQVAEEVAAEAAPAKRVAKRVPAEKVVATVTPAKKAPAKRAAAKKAAAKKVAVEKAPAKPSPVEKAPTRKAPTRKAPAKKVAAKKVAVETAPAKKVPAKKAAAKKGAVEKAAAKKAPAKRAAATEAVTDPAAAPASGAVLG